MKGLTAAIRDLNAVELRLGKMYGLKRIAREDFDRVMLKVDALREDLENTEELEGLRFGDVEGQTPWTPERIARERKERAEARGGKV